jgi:NurA-like 5'-3' nuclease
MSSFGLSSFLSGNCTSEWKNQGPAHNRIEQLVATYQDITVRAVRAIGDPGGELASSIRRAFASQAFARTFSSGKEMLLCKRCVS